MSKNDWLQVDEFDLEDFKARRESFKYVAHGPWKPLKGVGKVYCVKCGLVNLRNKITVWCIDKGCNNDDHPSYKAVLKRLTKN